MAITAAKLSMTAAEGELLATKLKGTVGFVKNKNWEDSGSGKRLPRPCLALLKNLDQARPTEKEGPSTQERGEGEGKGGGDADEEWEATKSERYLWPGRENQSQCSLTWDSSGSATPTFADICDVGDDDGKDDDGKPSGAASSTSAPKLALSSGSCSNPKIAGSSSSGSASATQGLLNFNVSVIIKLRECHC